MNGNRNCCCDVLFYIPGDQVDVVRDICNDVSAYRHIETHLHFLSIDRRCQPWFQYLFNHPSNTLRNWNPLFTVPSRRSEGAQEPGKFCESDLLSSAEYEYKKRAFHENSDNPYDEFCTRILQLISVTSGSVPYRTYLRASVRKYIGTRPANTCFCTYVLTQFV